MSKLQTAKWGEPARMGGREGGREGGSAATPQLGQLQLKGYRYFIPPQDDGMCIRRIRQGQPPSPSAIRGIDGKSIMRRC